MKITPLICATALMTASAFGSCTYNADTARISWKAFKTYEKIGVSGSFNRVTFAPHSEASIENLLVGSKVTIDTTTVNSGNSGRDVTLIKSFFKVQNLDTLNGVIVGVKDSKAITQITLNHVTKTIPLAYVVQEGKIIAKGTIDLGDFDLLPSLHSLSNACFDLHGGKTWQDVEIEFKIPFSTMCTPTKEK